MPKKSPLNQLQSAAQRQREKLIRLYGAIQTPPMQGQSKYSPLRQFFSRVLPVAFRPEKEYPDNWFMMRLNLASLQAQAEQQDEALLYLVYRNTDTVHLPLFSTTDGRAAAEFYFREQKTRRTPAQAQPLRMVAQLEKMPEIGVRLFDEEIASLSL